MDPTRFAVTLAVLLIGVGVGRLVLVSSSGTGEVMASLFVPPDQALGWPHGVQESDEPWGWRPPVESAVDPGSSDGGDDDGSGAGGTGAADWVQPPLGRFVVPVEPVKPVGPVVRPH